MKKILSLLLFIAASGLHASYKLGLPHNQQSCVWDYFKQQAQLQPECSCPEDLEDDIEIQQEPAPVPIHRYFLDPQEVVFDFDSDNYNEFVAPEYREKFMEFFNALTPEEYTFLVEEMEEIGFETLVQMLGFNAVAMLGSDFSDLTLEERIAIQRMNWGMQTVREDYQGRSLEELQELIFSEDFMSKQEVAFQELVNAKWTAFNALHPEHDDSDSDDSAYGLSEDSDDSDSEDEENDDDQEDDN